MKLHKMHEKNTILFRHSFARISVSLRKKLLFFGCHKLWICDIFTLRTTKKIRLSIYPTLFFLRDHNRNKSTELFCVIPTTASYGEFFTTIFKMNLYLYTLQILDLFVMAKYTYLPKVIFWSKDLHFWLILAFKENSGNQIYEVQVIQIWNKIKFLLRTV